jgi:hypothetical protein
MDGKMPVFSSARALVLLAEQGGERLFAARVYIVLMRNKADASMLASMEGSVEYSDSLKP